MENELDQKPIFIGGLDRSGKTTLQAILSSHPKIAIPVVGSNLWTYFFGKFGDLGKPENFDRCLYALLHYSHVQDLNPDENRIRKDFWEGKPTYPRLFAILHQHYAESIGKSRWGDQTGMIELYADQIMEAYPNAVMIQMVRDPRDRYEASLEMWPDGKGRVGGAAARWACTVSSAIQNQQKYPECYLTIRFEDLVRNTEATMRKVCNFIGEDFDPTMLQMGASPGHREKLRQGGNKDSITHPLSTEFIGRYRQRLSTEDIAFIQEFTKQEMNVLGYTPDPIHFSFGSRMKYFLIHRTINWLRMAAWNMKESIHFRFPRFVARRIPAYRILTSTPPSKTY